MPRGLGEDEVASYTKSRSSLRVPRRRFARTYKNVDMIRDQSQPVCDYRYCCQISKCPSRIFSHCLEVSHDVLGDASGKPESTAEPK